MNGTSPQRVQERYQSRPEQTGAGRYFPYIVQSIYFAAGLDAENQERLNIVSPPEQTQKGLIPSPDHVGFVQVSPPSSHIFASPTSLLRR